VRPWKAATALDPSVNVDRRRIRWWEPPVDDSTESSRRPSERVHEVADTVDDHERYIVSAKWWYFESIQISIFLAEPVTPKALQPYMCNARRRTASSNEGYSETGTHDGIESQERDRY
jgi:hypothetical protein